MKLKLALAAAAALILSAAPAGAAVTFFSIGEAGPTGSDPGKQAYETLRVDFEGATPPGVYAPDYQFTTGTSGIAAAPAGDTTKYLALGTSGSATFSMAILGGASIRSVSAYLGSIDAYNFIDIFSGSTLRRTISGSQLPFSSGDQGAARTNRRIYINFDASDAVTSITFRSDGVAFELDDIASSSARFNVGDGAFLNAMPPAVPEPATWAMMLLGFGMVGFGLRRRPGKVMTRAAFD